MDQWALVNTKYFKISHLGYEDGEQSHSDKGHAVEMDSPEMGCMILNSFACTQKLVTLKRVERRIKLTQQEGVIDLMFIELTVCLEFDCDFVPERCDDEIGINNACDW